MLCQACECLYINGLKCHETGCPEAWKDRKAECKWCGQEFEKEDRYQKCCSEDCAESYGGK